MTKRVVMLCGPRPTYGFSPVPPLTDSAPERNVFRLSKADYRDRLRVFVVSACSRTQAERLSTGPSDGRYLHVVFPDGTLGLFGTRMLTNRLVNAVSDGLLRTPDLFTRVYLSRACKVISALRPDVIFINSLPQYMRFLRSRFPYTKLGLFARGLMGSSRRYLSLMDGVITNSRGISVYVRQLLDGSPVPVSEIPNSLEMSFSGRRKDNSETGKRIIYAGRTDADKGVLELLRAYRAVRDRIREARLVIVGGNFGQRGLSSYETLLSEYSQENGLDVEFAGQVPNESISQHYLRADVAVFPSMCLESFGMVALEAMRCGLPVVASKRPGFEELVIPGETGVLVADPGNTESLAGAITQVLSNPELSRRLGEAGYKRSLRYTPEAAATQFERIVEEILAT